MTDDWLDQELNRSLRAQAPAPDFAATIDAATARLAAERRRRLGAGAGFAAAVAAIAVAVTLRMQAPDAVSDDFHIEEALLGSTHWTAPSDSLLPRREFDIYQDLPVMPGSTELQQGTL